ncbi:NAD-dependent epimerase/dehydratase family protein [Marinobacter sp. HL-58]|uniref:NAD-dependent epimerase/dehydratase family protein n=1 Tax=Marinobacter sp. HL-58 TaxID=1479237 RepID=UPI0004887B00|nr:NAD-dependent epimerase/dehydratase family protein [Marinobacter sp. HL-58]KPQ02368.1 MAG: nucleoside-diphosphate-sugar epimerase [Marinobacter sp. HL-58]
MTARKKVLITGATGFIGRYLVEALLAGNDFDVVVAGRRCPELPSESGLEFFDVGEINGGSDWRESLHGVQAVIHLAGLAHLNKRASSAAQQFHQVNVQGTLNLANQAEGAGVTHFLFMSSIGVNGNSNHQPFTVSDTPAPKELYAESKMHAEQQLKSQLVDSSMALTIVRPPLVYGPNAPGNFGLLCSIVKKPLPLPLAGIQNRRSFVSVWNLVDLLIRCLKDDASKGKTFLVRDGQDVSTSDFLRLIGDASGYGVRLFRVSHSFLKLAAACLGKKASYDRLFDSLLVDDSYTREVLGWTPPLTLEESLRKCF